MMKPILQSLAMAAAMLLATALLKYAAVTHLIGPEVATRGVQVVIGVWLAAYANFMPKTLPSAHPSIRLAALRQSILRFSGWLFTLSGIAYAGFWAFAPEPIARVGAIVAVACALVGTVAYTTWACATRGRVGAQ